MKRFQILLPDELYSRLRQQAFDEHKSIAEIIRFTLDSGTPITRSEVYPEKLGKVIDDSAKKMFEPKEVVYEKYEGTA